MMDSEDNTLGPDDCKAHGPWPGLLIYGLFQKGRVLAQDGMKQVARNLTDMWDGFLLGKRYLIHDRDPLFTEAVRGLLRDSGVKPLRLPRE